MAHDAQRRLEESIGVLLAQLDARAAEREAHFSNYIEDDVGDIVHRIFAVLRQPSSIDEDKVVVRRALFLSDPHFRRCGLVGKLDPQTLKELHRIIASETVGGDLALVEREQVLIEPPRVERVPAVQLDDHSQVDKPVHLDRFPECARGVGRHTFANLCDLLKLLAPTVVGLACRHLSGEPCVPSGIRNHRFGSDRHRAKFFIAIMGTKIGFPIEVCAHTFNMLYEVAQAMMVDLIVENSVAGRSLLHELGEHAGVERPVPLWRHCGKDLLPHRFSLPKGDHLRGEHIHGIIAHGKWSAQATIEEAQVILGVATQFGIGGGLFGTWPAFADNQLMITDTD